MYQRREAVIVTREHLEAKEIKSKLSKFFDNIKIVFIYDDTYLDELGRVLTSEKCIFLPKYDEELLDEIKSRFSNTIIKEEDFKFLPSQELKNAR